MKCSVVLDFLNSLQMTDIYTETLALEIELQFYLLLGN